MSEQLRRWIGPVPEKCDTCGTPIKNKFYDARTWHGPWACMCSRCQEFGPGLNQLGPSKGQEYTLKDGVWPKTGG